MNATSVVIDTYMVCWRFSHQSLPRVWSRRPVSSRALSCWWVASPQSPCLSPSMGSSCRTRTRCPSQGCHRVAAALRQAVLQHAAGEHSVGIQIKPQLEKVLNLAPDSLTKEIQLTQDLMRLFTEYQIPTDLMSFDTSCSHKPLLPSLLMNSKFGG